MLNTKLQPGDILVSNFGLYQHWSIVSDSRCDKGLPILISATDRNGTVQEESWDIVTQGKLTYPANLSSSTPSSIVLSLAKSQIGRWKYSVLNRNCEHFVRWAAGLEVSSTQVIAGSVGAIAGASLVGLLSKKPKALAYLGGAAAIGALAVLGSRALMKTHPKPM